MEPVLPRDEVAVVVAVVVDTAVVVLVTVVAALVIVAVQLDTVTAVGTDDAWQVETVKVVVDMDDAQLGHVRKVDCVWFENNLDVWFDIVGELDVMEFLELVLSVVLVPWRKLAFWLDVDDWDEVVLELDVNVETDVDGIIDMVMELLEIVEAINEEDVKRQDHAELILDVEARQPAR
jgi:hypothetical protein